MEEFINNLRNSLFGGQAKAKPTPVSRQKQVEARSGNNIRFPERGATPISENYKNTLMDAVGFYQREFKVTPNANIHNDPTVMPDGGTLGMAGINKSFPSGNYDVNLMYLDKNSEGRADEIAKRSSSNGWAVKNADMRHVPVHELGHVLFNTLFPLYDSSSNADNYGHSGNTGDDPGWYDYNVSIKKSQKLVDDAMKAIGKSDGDWQKEAGRISGYATTAPQEAIAESLADYYYNRDKAAPLSKSIVKRLKAKGSMYGINQTGGVDRYPTNNFQENLRRYSPLK